MTGFVEALWITIDVSFSLIKVRPTSLVIKQTITMTFVIIDRTELDISS